MPFGFCKNFIKNCYLDLKHIIAATASVVTMDPIKANVIFSQTYMSSKIEFVVMIPLVKGENTATFKIQIIMVIKWS